jgi:cytochrome c oxidase cbb3-type subunit 4
VFIAFIGLVLWAYSSRRKENFDEAANLPFADEPKPSERDEKSSRSNNE